MQVGFDVKGQFNVGFPTPSKVAPINTLATAFLAKEDTLSASARTVYTEDIRALLTASGGMLDQKSSGESQRVQSSEEIKRLDKQAVAFAKKIHRTMNYEFGDTPAQAADWGFDIKQTGKRKGTILMPDGRAAIVAMLDRYVKTEKGRAASDRFKSPVLADVQAVVDGLSENIGTRGTAKGQRASGTQQSIATATKVLDLLQGAAVQIVLKQFAGKVTPDLAQWGFDVTARTKSAAKAKTSKPSQPN
jgi:hypothetical protein